MEDKGYVEVDIEKLKIEAKEVALKKVIENTRLIKSLEAEKWAALATISDVDNERIYEGVSKVHKGILDSTTEQDILDILNDSLSSEEDIKFLLEYKNRRFARSGEVFEEHKDNPNQQDLVKAKLLSKREINKKTTAGQHISYLKASKDRLHKEKRIQEQLDNLEKQMKEQQVINSYLLGKSLEQDSFNKSVIERFEVQDSFNDLLKTVIEGIGEETYRDKVKQVTAYCLSKTTDMKMKELAKYLGVTTRSVYYWIDSVENLLEKKV